MSSFGVESTAVINIDLQVKGNLNWKNFAEQLESVGRALKTLGTASSSSDFMQELKTIQNQLNDLAATSKATVDKVVANEERLGAAEQKVAAQVKKATGSRKSDEQKAAEATAAGQQRVWALLGDTAAAYQETNSKIIASTQRRTAAQEKADEAAFVSISKTRNAEVAAQIKADEQLRAADIRSSIQRAAARAKAYAARIKAAKDASQEELQIQRTQMVASTRLAQQNLAEEQKVVRAQAAGDARATQGLVKGWEQYRLGIQNAQVAVKELVPTLQGLDRTFLSEKSNMNRVDTLLHSIGREAGLTEDQINQLQKGTLGLDRALEMIGKTGKMSGSQLASFKTQVTKIVDEQRIWAKDMQTLEGRLTFFQRMIDVVYRASFRLQMTGQQLQMWARQLVGYLSNIMDTFGQFQFNLNRAAGAILDWQNAGETGVATTQDLSNSVLDLAADLKIVPVADVAKAFYFWGSTAGETARSIQDLTDQQKSLDTIMRGAILTETDYETTIKGVYSILAQYYNGAVSEATHVTESLVYAAQKTAAEFTDLIQSFKMVGPIARANNVTFDDMVTVFGKLADLGIRGSMAGRAFRQFFIQIVKPSKDAAKMLQTLWASAAQTTNKYFKEFSGTSFRQSVFPSGQFVGITKYIDMLAKATSNMTAADKNALLAKITTANELPVLTALIIQQQRALNGLSNSTKDYATDTQTAAKYFAFAWGKLSDSWQGIVGSLERGFETLKVELGSVIADTLKPFIDTAQQVIDKMIVWAKNPANKQIIDFFVKLAAGAAAIAAVGGTLLALGGAFLGLASALGYVINVFGKFIPQTAIIVTGLSALAEGIVRNAGLLQQTFSDALATIQGALGDTSDSFTNLGDVVAQLLAPLRDFVDIGILIFSMSVKVVAQLAAWAIQLNKIVPVLNVIIGLLGAFVSYKILAGTLTLITRITGLAKVFGVLKTAIVGATAAKAGGDILGQMSWLNFAPQQAAAATKEIGLMGRAIGAAKGAATSFINVVGPQGIIALAVGAGWLAYQADFFGFRDFIDQITDHFRDLRKEIADLQSQMGDTTGMMGDRARVLATSIANENIFNFKDGNGVLDTGKMQKYIDDYTVQILAMWSGAVDEINKKLSGSGRQVEQIDFNAAFNKLANDVIGQPGSVTGSQQEHTAQLQMQIAEQILEMLPKGSDEATARAVYDQLTATYGQSFTMGWTEFLNNFAPYQDFKTVQTTNSQNLADSLFQNYLTQLQGAMDSNMSDEDKAKAVADILDTKLAANSFIPGAERLVGHSLLDALQGTFGVSTSPEFVQRVNYILNAIGMNYEDVMGDAIDEQLSPQQSRWTALSDKISSAIANANAIMIGKALDNLGVDSTGTAFTADSPLGKFLDDMYAGYFDDAAKILHDDIIPKLDTLPPDLQSSLKDAAKTLVEGTTSGIITPADLTALGGVAADAGTEDAKTLGEVAQTYMDALSGGTDKGWRDAIKNAMKKPDVKRIGGLIRQFVDKTLLAGLKDKHSLAAQKLAMQHLQDLMADITAVFDTPGMTANRKSHLAEVVIAQINELEKVTLPPAVKARLEEIRAQMEAILTGHAYVAPGKKGKKGTSGWANNLMPVDDMGNPFGTTPAPVGHGPGISTGIATVDTSGATAALADLQNTANNMKLQVDTAITEVKDNATTTAPLIPQAMSQGIYDGVDEVSSAAGSVKRSVTGQFGTIPGLASLFGVSIPREMASGMVQNSGQVSTAASTTADSVKAPFYSLMGQAALWGIHINTNLAAGLREVTSVGSIAAAAAAIAQVIYENLHHTYPEKGPLRHDAMTHSGEDAVKNFAGGMVRGTRNVVEATKRVARGVSDTLKKHHKKDKDETKKHHKNMSDEDKDRLKQLKSTARMWKKEMAQIRDQLMEHVSDARRKYFMQEMKSYEKSLKNIKKLIENAKHRGHGHTEDNAERRQRHHKQHDGLMASEVDMGQRKVTVDINVQSKDGSVGRMQLAEIRKSAIEAFSLSGIEHMVTVG